MNQPVVLRDLTELAHYRGEFAQEPEPPTIVARPTPPALDAHPDLLIQAVLRSARELEHLNERDASARREAETVLGHYRRLEADVERLRKLERDARQAESNARATAGSAFLPENRAQAEKVALGVAAIAAVAANRVRAIEAQMADLEAREDLSRLLAVERAEKVASQREERALAAIERAEVLASGHKYNEALRLLGSSLKENPNMPAVASSYDTIRRQAHAVKTLEVEKTLAEARRLHRREPARAAEILGGLDLSGMPSVLVRDVYGCWLQSCRRLGLVEAVHYSPGTGKGAMLVRDNGCDTRLKVVSAIGLPSWTPGRTFAVRALKGARPLAA
ncbi:MAG: hypothetical protein IT295_14115 [Dehalococcoidia bacterium]|nr:hypothetical protein [Dehalococcoidia bacterium]